MKKNHLFYALLFFVIALLFALIGTVSLDKNEHSIASKSEWGNLKSIFTIYENHKQPFEIIEKFNQNYLRISRNGFTVVILLGGKSQPCYKQIPVGGSYSLTDAEFQSVIKKIALNKCERQVLRDHIQ